NPGQAKAGRLENDLRPGQEPGQVADRDGKIDPSTANAADHDAHDLAVLVHYGAARISRIQKGVELDAVQLPGLLAQGSDPTHVYADGRILLLAKCQGRSERVAKGHDFRRLNQPVGRAER